MSTRISPFARICLALPALALSALAGAQTVTVARDPVTGVLRAPTAQEAQDLHAKNPTSDAGLKLGILSNGPVAEKKHANGTVTLELTRDTMVHSVIVRQADGSLRNECINGGSAANALATQQNKEEHQHAQ